MNELGIRPKRSLGQNFLISERVILRIIDEVRRVKPSALVEVGPGLGALTEGLLELDIPLRVIELDRIFAQYWRERGLDVIEVDALQTDWDEITRGSRTVLVSNLPYQISSSLVIERSLQPAGLTNMVLMFQKEVAQRIQGRPGSKDYGLLSVIAQTFWRIEKIVDAGRGDFFPPPKVLSRVLRFDARPTLEPSQSKEFLTLVKTGFAQRRKKLIRNLASWMDMKSLQSESVIKELQSLGHGESVRAEELKPEEWLALFKRFASPSDQGYS